MLTARIILCGLLLSMVFSCRTDNSDTDSIRMALLKGPSAVAFSMLLDSVYMVKGKRLEVTVYDNPEKVQALMIRKDVDLAVLPLSSAVNLYNKNIGYRLLACPVWGNLFWISSRSGNIENRNSVSLFGQGTMPDILLRHLLKIPALSDVSNFAPDYTFSTPQDLVQALLGGRVSDAILPEPFVSQILSKDSVFYIKYDLAKEFNPSGFAQTAVVVRSELTEDISLVRSVDSLLNVSVKSGNPDGRISSRLVRYGLLPAKVDARIMYDRCRIRYTSMSSLKVPVDSLIKCLFRYSPESIGGKLPDDNLYISGNSL